MDDTSSNEHNLVARRGGRKRDWFRAERGRLAGESSWLDHDHDAQAHEHDHGVHSDWNGQIPTGEFCGYENLIFDAAMAFQISHTFHNFNMN